MEAKAAFDAFMSKNPMPNDANRTSLVNAGEKLHAKMEKEQERAVAHSQAQREKKMEEFYRVREETNAEMLQLIKEGDVEKARKRVHELIAKQNAAHEAWLSHLSMD